MIQSLLLTLLDARPNSRHVEGVGLGPQHERPFTTGGAYRGPATLQPRLLPKS